jgi:hypothetical protein
MVKLKVLIACEFNGTVRDEFIRKGHEAISCDLRPTKNPGPHYQGDVRDILYKNWDMIISFPPCTYFTNAGNEWFQLKGRRNTVEKIYTRYILRVLAIEFFLLFVDHPCPKICIENPPGIMSTIHRKPNQYICHTDHGSLYPKRMGLWLKGLPPLMATKKMDGIWLKTKRGFRSPLTSNFSKRKRELIPIGVAKAMADEWG